MSQVVDRLQLSFEAASADDLLHRSAVKVDQILTAFVRFVLDRHPKAGAFEHLADIERFVDLLSRNRVTMALRFAGRTTKPRC